MSGPIINESSISGFRPVVETTLEGLSNTPKNTASTVEASTSVPAALGTSTVVQPTAPTTNSNPQAVTSLVNDLERLLTTDTLNKDKAKALLEQLSGFSSTLPASANLDKQASALLQSLNKPGADKNSIDADLNKLLSTFKSELAETKSPERSIGLMVQMLILLLKMAIESREANKQLREISVQAVVSTITAQADKLKTQAIATAITAAASFIISIASAAMTFKSAAHSKAAAKEGIDIRKQNQQLEQTQKIAGRTSGSGRAELDQQVVSQKTQISHSMDVKDALVNKAQFSSGQAHAISAGAQSINAASMAANTFTDSARKMDEAETQKQQNEQTKSAENRDYFEKLLAQVLEMLKQVLGSEAQIFKNISSR